MISRLASYKGCLLGLAVGDAAGYAVDDLELARIYQKYGADGWTEPELENGFAQTTSYTQIAAYACNGLLLGLTEGQMKGAMAPYVRYISCALQEWAQLQNRWRDREGIARCWISREERLFSRRCMDTRMLDQLSRGVLGTMEEPVNHDHGPGALTAAVPVGLFFDPERLPRKEIARLGAETVALTHGGPAAFLSGAALAHIISRITWDREQNLRALTRETIAMLKKRFGREYRQTAEVCQHLQTALMLAASHNIRQTEGMEQMGCHSASRVLAGAVYACICHPDCFTDCLHTAVNHSGASGAVAAVAGAIFGAMSGSRAIPAEMQESLEPAGILETLSSDMMQGCPMSRESRMFDIVWDEKYIAAGL